MRFVGWFEMVTGVTIAGLWAMLLTTGRVRQRVLMDADKRSDVAGAPYWIR